MYGGTERIVSYPTEELVRQEHRVTLYASGDSVTAAELVAITPRSFRLDPDVIDPLAHTVRLIERVMADGDRYDVIHFRRTTCSSAPCAGWKTSVATMHGRMDLPDLVPSTPSSRMLLVSISMTSAFRCPTSIGRRPSTTGCRWTRSPSDRPGSYLAFLGRTSPEKGWTTRSRLRGAATNP